MRETQCRQAELLDDNDWILLDETDLEELEHEEDEFERLERRRASRSSSPASKRPDERAKSNLRDCSANANSFPLFASPSAKKQQQQQLKSPSIGQRTPQTMALDAQDVELIRASWVPARKDPIGSGALLFKGLFTKFPDYLSFFSQFTDLDVENLRDNKRLIKHAVKVIDTVTFVVDSIGDQSKAEQLNEALVQLVASHLKRRIGLKEFRNLGIVIIDLVCDLQQRRPSSRTSSPSCENASLESMISSEAENAPNEEQFCTSCQTNFNHNHRLNEQHHNRDPEALFANQDDIHSSSHQQNSNNFATSLDTSLLVAAWTKLYGGILELVKRESGGEDQ